MLEVLNFLRQSCVQGVILDNGKILFEYDSFDLLLYSPNLERDFDDEENSENIYNENLEHFDFKLIESQKFESVAICSSEYPGYRDQNDMHFSLSLKMYDYLISLNKFSEDVVDSFGLLENYGYDEVDTGYCGIGPNYVFEIKIASKHWTDKRLYEYLLNECSVIEGLHKIPPLYVEEFERHKIWEDDFDLKILSTNTKARRIGYLCLISEFLDKYPKTPKHFINKKFETFALNYTDSLKSYGNDKGLISKSSTGVSSKPYVDIAINLGIFQPVSERYSGSKSFKVYRVVEKLLDKKENIFVLSDFDKVFFLELILEKDFIYLFSLLELIFIHEVISYKYLVTIFQKHLLQKLTYASNYLTGDKKLAEIKKVILRIQAWEEPDIYLEHVLMPRLNWLFDLKLLNFHKQLNVSFTASGKSLFRNICIWVDINHGLVINPKTFLNSYAIHLFCSIYRNDDLPNLVEEDQIKLHIEHYLTESFNYFTTLAPNRVTASQAINFTKYMLLFEKNIKVGYSYIFRILNENGIDKFIFRFQRKANDGYIQIKKT